MMFRELKTDQIYSDVELIRSKEATLYRECFFTTCKMLLSAAVNCNEHTRPQDWDLIRIFEDILKDTLAAFEAHLLKNGYTIHAEYDQNGVLIGTYDYDTIGFNNLLAPVEDIFRYTTDEYDQTMGIEGLR